MNTHILQNSLLQTRYNFNLNTRRLESSFSKTKWITVKLSLQIPGADVTPTNEIKVCYGMAKSVGICKVNNRYDSFEIKTIYSCKLKKSSYYILPLCLYASTWRKSSRILRTYKFYVAFLRKNMRVVREQIRYLWDCKSITGFTISYSLNLTTISKGCKWLFTRCVHQHILSPQHTHNMYFKYVINHNVMSEVFITTERVRQGGCLLFL